MKLITLIMTTPKGDRAEYKLFCCSRLPKTYLMDLYTLYVGKENQKESYPEHVQSIITLEVDTILEPSVWLDCIKWSRFRRQGQTECLEVFVSRPKESQMYYAVGPNGTILISLNKSIQIHQSTVDILCGESKINCTNPKIFYVDWKEHVQNEDFCRND